MLRAAFTSRSCTSPQRARPLADVQRQLLAHGAAARSTAWTTGNQRSTATSSRPYQAHLYSSMHRSSVQRRIADGAGERAVLDHVADGQVLDHDRLVLTDESSRQLVQEVPAPVGDPGVDPGDLAAGLVPVRRALGLAGQLPLRPGEPGAVAALVPGVGDFSPVDRVTRDVIPASMPTAAVGGGAPGRWCPRTAGTRTSVPPRPGTRSPWTAPHPRAADGTSRCPAARPSSPASARRRGSGTRCWCTRPTRRDFFRDLKRGYFARLAKKFVNAACRCRSACCSGTEDTSSRKASSSVFFHAVSTPRTARSRRGAARRTTPACGPPAPCCRPGGHSRTCATAPPPARRSDRSGT